MSKWTAFGYVVTLLAGGLSGALVNRYLEKDEYAIAASSCSDRGPEKVFIENVDTGYRREIPVAGDIPASIERILRIQNAGKKSIDDEYLHIAVENAENSKIFQTLIFYESPLSEHEVLSDEAGVTFRIKLKRFNPGDTMYMVVVSDRQVGVNVNSKGSGYTLRSSFKSERFCSKGSYGGMPAYSKLAEGCTLDSTLSLSCQGTFSYKIPPDFPPGRARLIFR